MRCFSILLAALSGLPLLVQAFHNVTYNANDPSVAYSPAGSWGYWPASGCLAWPEAQWTADATGSIKLKFYGVAVYAFGVFDDDTNPIYSFQVDNGVPTVLGVQTNPFPRSCNPIYSKIGLKADDHTITLKMTNTKPGDVKDLAFEGFIVTVPDAGDVHSSTNAGDKSRTLFVGAAGTVAAIITMALATV